MRNGRLSRCHVVLLQLSVILLSNYGVFLFVFKLEDHCIWILVLCAPQQIVITAISESQCVPLFPDCRRLIWALASVEMLVIFIGSTGKLSR